jgi:phospholipid transport system substrate-binding protein
MTQLAMGRKWRQATPEQRAALVPEFRTLLVRTYSSALIQYVDQKLEYLPLKAKPEDTQVVIHTLVKQSSGGAPVQIDYRMIKNDTGWKVFDVMVAGVSLVVTYRSSFDEIITGSGVDGLIKELRTKNQNGTT